VSTDRKTGVQEEYAAVCPGCEQAGTVWRGLEGRVVVLQALIDVDKGRGCGSWCLDGKAEAMGLSVIVVGILTNDHCFDGVERCVAGPFIF
jgi:hypothetical protein